MLKLALGTLGRRLSPFTRAAIIRRRHSARRLRIDELQTHPAGTGLVIESYWLATPTDEGPAFSVRALGDEVWRVDLFLGNPHVHLNCIDTRTTPSPHEARIKLGSTGADDPFTEAFSFVHRNVTVPFALNRRRAIRNLAIDRAMLDRALDDTEAHLTALLTAHRKEG